MFPLWGRVDGCGTAMHLAPIGQLYYHPDQIKDLVGVAIESGRTTRHHLTDI